MKITYQNPKNLLVEFRLLEPGKWLVNVDVDSPAWLDFDVDTRLQDYNPRLPDCKIVAILFDRYAIDSSGYEYFGWILYTAL